MSHIRIPISHSLSIPTVSDNMTDYRLSIDIPSGKSPLVEYGRDFDVQGKIEGDLEDDLILIVRLYDENGNVLRYARQDRKNDRNLYLDHKDLITYEEGLDPGKEKLKEYGFPELLVKDLNDPEVSLHDATIKCFYDDDSYKAIIVSASDVSRGRIMETGLDLKDENGKAYESLKKGKYLLEVSLYDKEERLLAKQDKKITIDSRKEVVIIRFNPIEHRKMMTKWCEEKGFTIINDTLPGYLEPYLGKWYYHMGLLKYYRSNDIAIYSDVLVHMFVYLCDPTSTSYATELAYLGSLNRIDDERWFKAYHYDIGEALIGKGTEYERKGRILEFEKDEISISRIDLVDEKAKENIFDISEKNLNYSYYDLDDLKIPCGTRIAVHTCLRPRQFEIKAYVLKEDNTYDRKNEIKQICFAIDDGKEIYEEERSLMMERVDEERSIGFSVYEAYNIFELKDTYKGKKLRFTITLKDMKGNILEGERSFEIEVI